MSRRDDLRIQRAGTVINATSKKQETALIKALENVVVRLQDEFEVNLDHVKEWRLRPVINRLREEFPDVPFSDSYERSAMKPDGGILALVDNKGEKHTILIVEVKHQGTNDLRKEEGKPRQGQGNAIERLGKNIIGFRTAMLSEAIMPFVCFGYGCDFAEGSSIRDRVLTIAMFGPLNEISVVNQGDGGMFNRGSFFFREAEWTPAEMETILFDVASRSVHYYFAKHGPQSFATERAAGNLPADPES